MFSWWHIRVCRTVQVDQGIYTYQHTQGMVRYVRVCCFVQANQGIRIPTHLPRIVCVSCDISSVGYSSGVKSVPSESVLGYASRLGYIYPPTYPRYGGA